MKTKVKILASALMAITLMFASVSSKADVFGEGAKLLNVGIGVGSAYQFPGSSSSFPPLHASFEYGVTENISIGALVGYTASTYDATKGLSGFNNTYAYTWNFTYFLVGLRGAYHYEVNDKTDLYGGLMLGWDVATVSLTSGDPNIGNLNSLFNSVKPNAGGFSLGIYGGARYMFTDHVGAFAELGYSIAFLSVGGTLKF